ncbi:hypothetical protein LV78_003928 [Actinosynnema pretiosum]|nr:hypothetical protein [Actinosynnema pretiosum]
MPVLQSGGEGDGRCYMIKCIALYRRPDRPEEFDEAYFASHLPLVLKTPGLLRVEVARAGQLLIPGFLAENEPHLIAEMYFESEDAMNRAFGSPEWQAGGANLSEIGAAELISLFTAEVLQSGAVVDGVAER